MKHAVRQLLIDLLKSRGQDGSKAEVRARARAIKALALSPSAEADREAIQADFAEFNALAIIKPPDEETMKARVARHRELQQRDRAWGMTIETLTLEPEQARGILEIIDRMFPVDAGISERLAEGMDELSDLKDGR